MLKWQFDFKTAFSLGIKRNGEFVLTLPFIGFLTNKKDKIRNAYGYFFFNEFDVGFAINVNFMFVATFLKWHTFGNVLSPFRRLWLKTYRTTTIRLETADHESVMWGKKVVYNKVQRTVFQGFLFPVNKYEGIIIKDETGKETFSKLMTPVEYEQQLLRARDILDKLEKDVHKFCASSADDLRRSKANG